MLLLVLLASFAVLPASPRQSPPAPTEAQNEFFETNIRPVLANDCQSCHGDAKMGGLRMSSLDDMLKGGVSGPAIVAGQPEKSLLIAKIREADAARRMPKGGQRLKDAEIANLETWIRDGAFWPKPVVVSADAKARFFEEHVRPVIAFKCYTCHTNTQMGGLQLDTLEGMLKGGKSGPAIVPGDPDKSLLVSAIRRTGALQMPKNGSQLSAAEIADIAAWIKDGAYWPAAAKEKPFAMTAEQQKLWSIQPQRKTAVPRVKDSAWPVNEIDNFVLAKLESEGLKPVGPASRRSLLRRASFDLTGLPPTYEEIRAFENDKSPNAWEKAIDRLQASAHYGEKWARHWMDAARFGEDNYSAGGQQRAERYEFAYTYRDWLINAFNTDVPYDYFVRAQLAGDMLPEKETEKAVPGLGFHGLGVWNSMAMAAQIERANDWHDRVDVTTKVFLGLTVGCARCHDHKYDAIPTKDYYRLAGVFASSQYKAYPLVSKSAVDEYEAKQKVLDAKQKDLNDLLAKAGDLQAEIYFLQTESYMVAAWRVGSEKRAAPESIAEKYKLDLELLQRWVRFLKKPPVNYGYLKTWQEMAARGGTLEEAQKLAKDFYGRIVAVREEKEKIKADNEIEIAKTKDPNAKDLFDPLPNGKKRSLNIYLTALKGIDQEKGQLFTDIFENDLPDPNQIGDTERQPGLLKFTGFALEKRLPGEWANQIAQMRSDIDAFKKAMGNPYPFAYGMGEAEKPVDLRVFLRGNPDVFGEEAPRAFLAMLTNGQAKPFSSGSGRLELAEEILRQPIADRVIANRIWGWMMGSGIVLTANNFGIAGSRPSNADLLEYLAARFRSDGMSFKKMQKFIMMSRTYQLASDDTEANRAKDPDNRWYWKANTKRLDAEAVWDYLFAAGGNLDVEKIGGVSKELAEGMNRRGVYGTSSRMFPNTFQLTFDFQTPTNSVERRYTTIIPQQQLFFLNSPIVHKEAALLAERAAKEATPENQVRKVFEIVLQREPSPTELSTAVEFVAGLPPMEAQKAAEPMPAPAAAESKDPKKEKEKESPFMNSPLKHLGWAVLSSNEFLFIN